ncbi:hypothetical protein BX070DRAFT_248143 [Coemansia spiralis]|nr:hypothetical protein BX070DRAFT_248143 [Coemansia spiralis]
MALNLNTEAHASASTAHWQEQGKLFETIELWSNGSLLLIIHNAQIANIHTIGDIKRYLEGVTRIPKKEIVLCHIPTAMVYKDKQKLPLQQVQMFAVNILRVDFHIKYSARSDGVETIFVSSDRTVGEECKINGLPLKRKAVLCKKRAVSPDFDIFRGLDTKNGDIFQIKNI